MNWCIISDVDDTLFHTSSGIVPCISAFIHTFLIHPEPIEGMPDLFHILQHTLPRSSFCYISASPHKLLPFRTLSIAEFPMGKVSTPSFKEALCIYLQGSLRNFKMTCVEEINRSYPSSNLLLFGDSLMRDPEIYGEVYRKHPDRVFSILIRKYKNVERKARRFERAFKNVPSESYCVFETYSELILYLQRRVLLITPLPQL